MSEIKLSNRYAKALLEDAKSKGSLDAVYHDMVFVKEAIEKTVELASVLKSPVINQASKIQIADKVFKNLSSETKEFVKFLIEKNREKYLNNIATAFISQYYDLKGITLLQLTTPVAIEKESINKIVESVKKQLNLGEVKVTTKTDAKILGGFVIKIGEKVYDASIASRMDKIKRVLTA